MAKLGLGHNDFLNSENSAAQVLLHSGAKKL
jgi:hypothetical protein